MTIQEFNEMAFGFGDKAEYIKDGKMYNIYSIDFEEKLFCLSDINSDDLFWVRCESVIFHEMEEAK